VSTWGLNQRTLVIAIAGAAAFTACVFLGREESEQRWLRERNRPNPGAAAEFNRIYGQTDLQILQFYARDGVVTEGGSTVICYGVLNARSVAIAPPAGDLSPSISRCLEVSPMHDTEYTLTATGADGRSASASLRLRVAPDPESLPRIDYFRIDSRKKDYTGQTLFVLAYADRNGEEISIDPPVFPTLHRSPYGRFYVAPRRTTTYTLKVRGKFGHAAERRLTVEVPEGQP